MGVLHGLEFISHIAPNKSLKLTRRQQSCRLFKVNLAAGSLAQALVRQAKLGASGGVQVPAE